MWSGLRAHAVAVPVAVLVVCGAAVTLIAQANRDGVAGTPASTEPSRVTTPNARGARVGFSSHLIWTNDADMRDEMSRLRSAGMSWLREDFLWDLLEPSRGTFDWTMTDRLMANAAETDIDVLAILDYSAEWAISPANSQDVSYPPSDPADFGRYAAAVVARYGAGGTFWSEHRNLKPRPLSAVEIWNEPFAYWNWKPEPDPAAYARLARAGAEAIRASNRDITILIPGDLLQRRQDGRESPWLNVVLQADPGLVDIVSGFSMHPYPDARSANPYAAPTDGRAYFGQVGKAHDLLVARAVTLPIWITEVGWSTAPKAPGAVSEQQQASYVRDAVRRVLQDWPFVARIFIYSYDRDGRDVNDREQFFGVFRADGSAKPAWTELEKLVR